MNNENMACYKTTMKQELIRWQNLFHPRWPITYSQFKEHRPYLPYANKKSFYMHIMTNLAINQSVIIKNRCLFTVRLDWVGHVVFWTKFRFKIESLEKKIHKVTRIA
jgi:hypothetical protein